MRRLAQPMVLTAVLVSMAWPVTAGEVVVQGMHVCCPACRMAIVSALQAVPMITALTVSDENVAKFQTPDDDGRTAQAAVDALHEAGFYGKATHAGQNVPFPAEQIKAGVMASEFRIYGSQLCCGECVENIRKLLSNQTGVEQINANRFSRLLIIRGNNIDVERAVLSLRASGLAAELRPQ